MRKPAFGKQRSVSGKISSLSKQLPRPVRQSATPPVERRRPNVNKPPSSSEIRRK